MRTADLIATFLLAIFPLGCGESGAGAGEEPALGDPGVDGALLGFGALDAGGGQPPWLDVIDGNGVIEIGNDVLDGAAPDLVALPDLPLRGRDEGTTAPCGFGTIRGLVCSRAEQMYVDGAAVQVDAFDCGGNPIRRLTLSDAEGYFTLTDVPAGLQTVHVRKDDFSYEFTVLVEDGQVTDITGAAYKDCFLQTGDRCVEGQDDILVESQVTSGLADIVWFIDTSGSMEAEANWVQQNINAFAQYIGSQQIDYHVVLVADGYDLCVPPPLGGPGCTDGPRFRHVHERVGSNDGLEVVIASYPQYQDFLREGATTNFIAVTDDNSDEGASWFRAQVARQTAPGFSDPFVFHSIVAYGPLPFIGCITGAFTGLVYLELSNDTGGATFPICQADWASIFHELAETVVETLPATCSYALPDPEAATNADEMTLVFLAGAQATSIAEVAGEDACGATGGWYRDDRDAPTTLVLCPATCRLLTDGVLRLTYICLP